MFVQEINTAIDCKKQSEFICECAVLWLVLTKFAHLSSTLLQIKTTIKSKIKYGFSICW